MNVCICYQETQSLCKPSLVSGSFAQSLHIVCASQSSFMSELGQDPLSPLFGEKTAPLLLLSSLAREETAVLHLTPS